MLEAHRRNHTGQDRPFTGFIPENSTVSTGLASRLPQRRRPTQPIRPPSIRSQTAPASAVIVILQAPGAESAPNYYRWRATARHPGPAARREYARAIAATDAPHSLLDRKSTR